MDLILLFVVGVVVGTGTAALAMALHQKRSYDAWREYDAELTRLRERHETETAEYGREINRLALERVRENKENRDELTRVRAAYAAELDRERQTFDEQLASFRRIHLEELSTVTVRADERVLEAVRVLKETLAPARGIAYVAPPINPEARYAPGVESLARKAAMETSRTEIREALQQRMVDEGKQATEAELAAEVERMHAELQRFAGAGRSD